MSGGLAGGALGGGARLGKFMRGAWSRGDGGGARRPARRARWEGLSGIGVFADVARGAFKGRTHFGKFLRSALAARADDSGGVAAPVCPRKRPLCLMSVSVRSATLRLLHRGDLRPRQLREAFEGVAILALEFQHSGRQDRWPYGAQPAAARWSRRLSSGQKRAQLVLKERCRKFAHRLQRVPKVSLAGGRCADKVARALGEAYCAGKVRAAKASAAEWSGGPLQVKADRIAIPECGRTFDGARYLVPKLQAGFVDPERLLKQRSASEPPRRILRARFHVSPTDQRALFTKMDAAGMLEAEYEHNVPRGPGGESLACGMFAVPKDPEADRLITNRIPANSTEQSMQASRDLFPHASCFCELQLSRNEELSISALDLPDF